MSELLFTFYGDDFTGSTDALEVVASSGLQSVLFTEPPTAEMLLRYPGVQAVGLAGVSRSLSPAEMDAELRPAFDSLRSLNPRHLHYKVCSTFDSSPEIGSIGRAIEIGSEYSPAKVVPLLVGNPKLGRYCVFGNLFAQVGVGHDGIVHRLDRHPTVSHHPITPMRESDLRLHLARQTEIPIALFDILKLELPAKERQSYFREIVAEASGAVLLDVLHPRQLAPLGALIDEYAMDDPPLFSVGSSGVEAALCEHWLASGKLAGVKHWSAPKSAEQVLVVSGSCSPVTDAQIGWAVSQGFAEIALETCVLTDEDCDSYLLQVAANLVRLVSSGKSVVVHICRGNSDPRIAATARRYAKRNDDSLESKTQCSRRIGSALGRIIAMTIERTGIKRVCLAGGDTSSFATRQMGIAALEMICPTVRGAPLCKAYAPGQPVDGIEICFKGGQVGQADYFGTLLRMK